MKKIILYLFIMQGTASVALAQSVWDGLLFSQNRYEGTARFTAMGGAFTALGGDFTSLSINPAGVGVYRGTEITISPSLYYNLASAEYLGKTADDSYTGLSNNNLGIVFGGASNSTGLVSFNWGIGYNKVHNVLNHTSAQGVSLNNSKLSFLADDLSGRVLSQNLDVDNAFSIFPTDSWAHVLAWQTYLIDTTATGNGFEYIAAVENDTPGFPQSGPLKQSYYCEQKGSTGEYVLSFGGNVDDRFYFGATFGLQSISNDYYTRYSETAVNEADFNTVENSTQFRSFTHHLQLNTRGTGYNAKFGIIWKPVAGLRWGAYIHTPTWIYLTDEYSERMEAYYSDGFQSDAKSDLSIYDYKTITPAKWGTGFAYTFGSNGLISAEYEGVNYSNIKMYGSEDGHYVRLDNATDDARDLLGLATNIRVGGEYRLNQLALRAGYAYYGSPIKNDHSAEQHIVSLGLGYQWNGFFLDGAYAFSPNNKETFTAYNGSSNIKNINFAGKFIVTLGIRF